MRFPVSEETVTSASAFTPGPRERGWASFSGWPEIPRARAMNEIVLVTGEKGGHLISPNAGAVIMDLIPERH